MATTSLFPLPATPFERYLLADDRPAYPMTFVLHMRLLGPLQREAFEEALAEVLPRHPLLQALWKPHWNGGQWVSAAGQKPLFHWDAPAAALNLPNGTEQIDITQEIGLRVWVRANDQQADVYCQFHHACCDGLGGFNVLGEWLAAYGIRTTPTGETLPKLADLKPELLPTRGAFRGRVNTDVTWWQGASFMASETVKTLTRRPTPLAAPQHTEPWQPVPFPGYLSVTCEDEAFQQLRQKSQQADVSLNDLLIRDLLLVIDAWNRQHGRTSDLGWLCLNMPTNLRERDDWKMPAANVMSYALLTRSLAECRSSPDELLQSIHQETAAVKNWRLGEMFLQAIALGQSVPGMLPLLLSFFQRFSTAVLSNLGDPTRRFTAKLPRRHGRTDVGNDELDLLTCIPPLRPFTRLSMTANTYNGHLTVNLRCDPHLFSAADTHALLHRYCEQLAHSRGE